MMKLIDDERGIVAFAGAYLFWLELCLDCKIRILNRKLLPKNIRKYLDQSDLQKRVLRKL